MIGAVLQRVNALSDSNVFADGLVPSVTSGIVIAVDYDPAGKVTMLLFCADGEPCLVAKLGRSADAEPALLAEHAALLEVWSTDPRTVTAQLPRPIALDRIAGKLMLLASALPGVPMTTSYYLPGHVRRRRRVAADFAAAGTWLARFQDETRTGTADLGPAAFGEWVEPVFRRYEAAVGWGDWEPGLMAHLANLCRRLSGARVPVVAVHGDYAPGNILVAAGRVSGVVDWELGRTAGLPFSDVFKFAASYGAYLDRASPSSSGAPVGHPGWSEARERWGATSGWPNATGILYAFFGSGWFPELVRSYLRHQLHRLGAPPATTELFLLVFVAEQVTALQQPDYRDGYRALLRLLWEESAAGHLPPLDATR